jgi:outer membrane protein
MHRRAFDRSTAVVLGAGVLALAGGDGAQAKAWIATIGGRVTTAPPYEGAGYNVARPSPTINLRPADRPYRFSPPDGGATVAIFDTDHFSIGPVVRIRYKREVTGKLAGFREVDWAAEAGGFVDIWPTQWLRGHAEVRHGEGGHTGVVADLGGDLVYTGSRWDASIGPRLGWGDKKYLNRYFGVSPMEAALSPLVSAPYTATAGRRYAGIAVAAAYHFDRNWTVKADLGYRSLADKAAASPIVRVAGSTSQYLASIGLSYSFNLRL